MRNGRIHKKQNNGKNVIIQSKKRSRTQGEPLTTDTLGKTTCKQWSADSSASGGFLMLSQVL